MDSSSGGLVELLAEHGVSRRAFLQFSAAMASALALPATYAPRIANALETKPRVPVVWLEGQDCAGNTEGLLRASHPTVADLIFDIVSLEYHETIMAAAGTQAEQVLADTVAKYKDGYIAVVEGGIPLADGGIYCTIGGKAFNETVKEVCGNALATIAVGSCAFDGGLPAAQGGPTGAVGASSVVRGKPVINLPGCPMNVQNLTATIVHYITFGEWPATDSSGRPLFAYGQLIHDQCERRSHFERGEYVLEWGDYGSLNGWCLYKMGCKGPETYANCPTARFNDGTSWPVKSGHGCVGCTMPAFWDQMSPFYARLETPPPFATNVTADDIGLALVAFVAGASALHGVASYTKYHRSHRLKTPVGSTEDIAEGAVAVGAPPPAPIPPAEPVPPIDTGLGSSAPTQEDQDR
jgi:hydrogenase small subunit